MSFLSPQQQYLLAVLNEIGCLRKNQAAELLRRKYGASLNATNCIIRQTKDIGYLRVYENILSTVGEGYNGLILQAVDIVLAVCAQDAPQIMRTTNPFVLSAYSEQNDLIVKVLHVPVGKEEKRCTTVDNMQPSEIQSLVIMLLDASWQMENLHTKAACLAAYPQENGKLKLAKCRKGQ